MCKNNLHQKGFYSEHLVHMSNVVLSFRPAFFLALKFACSVLSYSKSVFLVAVVLFLFFYLVFIEKLSYVWISLIKRQNPSEDNEPVIRLFLIDLRVSVCVGSTSKCADWKRRRIRQRA